MSLRIEKVVVVTMSLRIEKVHVVRTSLRIEKVHVVRMSLRIWQSTCSKNAFQNMEVDGVKMTPENLKV